MRRSTKCHVEKTGKQEIDYACQTSPVINVRRISEATRGRLVGGSEWSSHVLPTVLHSQLSAALSQQAARLTSQCTNSQTASCLQLASFTTWKYNKLGSGEDNGCLRPGDKFCLCVIGCSGEQSGCSAFEYLVCVIRGLWFGTGPECHDVYPKLKSCGFLLLHIISSVSWRWLSIRVRTTRVPEEKVPTFCLCFIQGSNCQIRKQLSYVFSAVENKPNFSTSWGTSKTEGENFLTFCVYEDCCPFVVEELWWRTSLGFLHKTNKRNISIGQVVPTRTYLTSPNMSTGPVRLRQ